MHTESSHRFERGVDPGGVRRVLAHALSMTVQLSPEARAAKDQIHAAATARLPPRITLRRARMDQLLGVSVPWANARAILERLGFAAGPATDSEAQFGVPTHRPDCSREVDLIEEVIRVHGMDHVPAELPAIRPSRAVGGAEERARRARQAAAELGLSEAVTYAFTSRAELAAARAPEAAVVLKNPIASHHEVMRTSLAPGLYALAKRAKNHGVRDAAVFTVGSVYLASKSADGLPEERLGLAALLVGDRPAYLSKPAPVDAWDAKGVAVGLVERLSGRTPTIRREEHPHLHPRGSAGIYLDDARIGRLGPVHPDLLEALDIGEHAQLVELDLELVGEPRTPKFQALPRFPASTRDIALVVHDDVAAGDVVLAAREAAGPLAEEVALFDRFVGGSIPKDHASVALHVVYRAPDRTLTDAEVDQAHAKVEAAVKSRFNATLRQ
jgi:phenylalanyl-tRNA synthetase beta chain